MVGCTRCGGTGFLNIEQVPEEVADQGCTVITGWIAKNETDACVCDCCGNGEEWYGEPGQHYGSDDPKGESGPYAYNGGLCECH